MKRLPDVNKYFIVTRKLNHLSIRERSQEEGGHFEPKHARHLSPNDFAIESEI